MHGGELGDAGSILRFAHPPTIRPLQPVTDVTVEGGRSARLRWEDMDLDEDAKIRIVLSAEDHGLHADYETITAGLAFVVNSVDGSADSDVNAEHDISEDDEVDAFDVHANHLRSSVQGSRAFETGTYHVYLAISETGRFDGSTRASKAPGRLRFNDPLVEPSGTEFRLLPEAFTIGTGGPSERIDVVVNAGGEAADLVVGNLWLDGDRYAAVDQDTTVEGVQPFIAGGFPFSAAKLATNSSEELNDGDRRYGHPLKGELPIFDILSARAQLDLDPFTSRRDPLPAR